MEPKVHQLIHNINLILSIPLWMKYICVMPSDTTILIKTWLQQVFINIH